MEEVVFTLTTMTRFEVSPYALKMEAASCSKLHGITSQKNVLRTSNLTQTSAN
jgi:hypothetical protein